MYINYDNGIHVVAEKLIIVVERRAQKIIRGRTKIRNCWNERAVTIIPPLPSATLPHERVRKVRSVQKSREVIYHLWMIAPCAMKAIRFNACIHAAPKSFAYFARALSFFFLRTYGTSYAMHLYYVGFPWSSASREFPAISVRSRFVSSTRHFVAEFTGLPCDSFARYVYYGTRIRFTFLT